VRRTPTETRVAVREPTASDREALISLNRASRTLHRGRVAPPTTPEEYDEFLQRCDQDDHLGLLICRKGGGAIVGVANLSQIFYGCYSRPRARVRSRSC